MPARLYHERIGTAPRALLVTHGILGSGANWRSIARKVVAQRPDWAIELVDLRGHGRSEPGEAPHTLAASAADLRALLDELPDIVAVAGHSFGGKTVLAMRPIAPARLLQTWIFDASPGVRDGASDPSVARVLASLERAAADLGHARGLHRRAGPRRPRSRARAVARDEPGSP